MGPRAHPVLRRELRSAGLAAGFTLVEMMVVVILLGMVAGLASFSWERVLPRERLNSDVRALASRLYGTRSDAIARNAEFRMVYDLDTEEYWVETPFREEGGGLALGPEEERMVIARTKLSQGVSLETITIDGKAYAEGRVYVRFDALGSASDHWVVLAQEAYDAKFTLEVQALTGLIGFHEGFFERREPKDSDFN